MTSDPVQRRTVRTLVAAQAIGALGITIGIATASLLARDISGKESMAGLAQTFQVLGAAVASYLLARLMSARGRRAGLLTGIGTAAVGSLLCVAAGKVDSMPLLLVGAALLGAMSSANYAARYAATDLAEPDTRARSLSVVVWGTTLGAVLGPNLSGPSGDVAVGLGLPELTGPFLLGTVAMGLAALVIAVWLRPDPLLLARERAGAPAAPPTGTSWGRAFAVLRERPVVLAAMVATAFAHAVMIAVMAMTPLHMEHGHAELEVIGLVISLHVLGMFAFAPLVGWAADRVGRVPLLAASGATLLAATSLCGRSPMGSSWEIFAGLFLLGLGWSLATVAGATLVTDHTPLSARPDVQGLADLLMGVAGAGAGAIGGVVVGALGYGWLNAFAALLAGFVLLAALFAGRSSPDRHLRAMTGAGTPG